VAEFALKLIETQKLRQNIEISGKPMPGKTVTLDN
jgi:hypothetical protein